MTQKYLNWDNAWVRDDGVGAMCLSEVLSWCGRQISAATFCQCEKTPLGLLEIGQNLHTMSIHSSNNVSCHVSVSSPTGHLHPYIGDKMNNRRRYWPG